MEKQREILRIIYWLRRYGGIRDKVHGKIWTSADLNLLEQRINEYFNHPENFNLNNPDMNIDMFGFIDEESEEQ